MNNDFFKGIKQWEINMQDMQFKMPIFYYDTTTITAIYTASTGKVKALLPLPQMNPIELLPGKCLVAFTAFEYRKTDIDSYNEFAISFVTNIYFNQLEFAESRDKQAAALEIGSGHRICDDLQKIGLSATPVVYQYSPLNQAILFAGRNLLDN